MTEDNMLNGLKAALPYLRLYRGKCFVIKVGGESVRTRESVRKLLDQVATFHFLGIRVVLVHGGGPISTEVAGKLGVETKMVGGRRVTSPEMIDVLSMTLNGAVRTQILSVAKEIDLPCVGLSGVDAGLISAERRPPVEVPDGGVVDFGEVGDVRKVDPAVLTALLEDGYVPVVSPLSADAAGAVLNVNADTVAAEIAAQLHSEKLVFVGTMPGICTNVDDPSTLLSHLELKDLDVLTERGVIKTGMLPKALAIRKAIEEGVPRVHLVAGGHPDCLLVEVFTNEGCGTLVEASKEPH